MNRFAHLEVIREAARLTSIMLTDEEGNNKSMFRQIPHKLKKEQKVKTTRNHFVYLGLVGGPGELYVQLRAKD